MKNNKGSTLVIVLIIVALFIVGGGIYFLNKNKTSTPEISLINQEQPAINNETGQKQNKEVEIPPTNQQGGISAYAFFAIIPTGKTSLMFNYGGVQSNETKSVLENIAKSVTGIKGSDLKGIYQNKKYNFQFSYPSDWEVKEYSPEVVRITHKDGRIVELNISADKPVWELDKGTLSFENGKMQLKDRMIPPTTTTFNPIFSSQGQYLVFHIGLL